MPACCCGAQVLKYWTQGYPFFFALLEPWKHYVPIRSSHSPRAGTRPSIRSLTRRSDLSDLLQTVRYLRDHDDEARAIGERGRAFAASALSPPAVHAHLRAYIAAHAQLQAHATIRREPHDRPVASAAAPPGYVRAVASDHKGRPFKVVCPAANATADERKVWQAGSIASDYFRDVKKG